ncbi:YqzE family protein [Bacillus kwashiorkori]|uniref:YqzE family protein n=1 Tax=Bacillus kwashiorkori TaxID=1522318 RepID=UPI000781B7F7|nr:YqzE family protein [Bacillus kwashiorkori]
MKSNDYVKFLTQTVIQHFDTPKEERKRIKVERKQVRDPFMHRWFGIMPFVVGSGIKMAKEEIVDKSKIILKRYKR